MQLICYPNPILLSLCKPINESTERQSLKKRRLLQFEMSRIMNKYNGVGLAAPQVGLNLRIFAWRHDGLDQVIWNPILSDVSGNMESTEGCLSLPYVSVTLQRATLSVLSGFAVSGRPIRFVGDSSTTRIWQHEIDHLDGKLIIDNMSKEETVANRDAIRTLLKNTVA